MATIAVIGTLDSKGEEHAYLAECIRKCGHEALLMDVGSGGAPTVEPDISRYQVAEATGVDLESLMQKRDRGECVAAMAAAAPVLLSQLVSSGRVQGVISAGGGGGTAISTAAMRALPLGFPKVMVSTMAGGNTAPYVGTSDVVMFPSIVDVAGLNSVSLGVFSRAAGAICGMVEAPPPEHQGRPLVVATMFGNTTACVTEAKRVLEEAGFEVLVFSACGTGGRTMESLVASGMVAGVLDLTTTEWADELVGGVLSAGPHRLEAAGIAGLPTVVAPGCLDMVNFGEPETVPDRFEGRKFYYHNPQVTLLRTSVEESRQLGGILAEKINAYRGPVSILMPERGFSAIGEPGGVFEDQEADAALMEALESDCGKEVLRFPLAINDPAFARACAEKLLSLLRGD
ncbi:uncharacterized protein (UPF0261 family) [Haloferula luteola]|uniref:Uncharacterized protein (UPF0261 family) n=1 Tax=Haloferula luteola TaxID=595692 RepID=A0A840VHT8_9BACT|nr:Tm-1-like ATP-binding domain-containing protein [Haloferula luteola]MBB5352301.1 uncharacterized protein (UPF0261 family) [Haloferula luteola]